jgi:hypothetical protein
MQKKSPPKVSKAPEAAKVAYKAMKTVTNVSLQAWSIPVGFNEYVDLTPGSSVAVPINMISNRVINLQKRRLIEIS